MRALEWLSDADNAAAVTGHTPGGHHRRIVPIELHPVSPHRFDRSESCNSWRFHPRPFLDGPPGNSCGSTRDHMHPVESATERDLWAHRDAHHDSRALLGAGRPRLAVFGEGAGGAVAASAVQRAGGKGGLDGVLELQASTVHSG